MQIADKITKKMFSILSACVSLYSDAYYSNEKNICETIYHKD